MRKRLNRRGPRSGRSSQIRLALVGLGAVSLPQRRAIRNTSGFRLVATCDVDTKRRLRLSGVPFFTRVDRMLRDSNELDAVLVSVPPADHYDVGRQVLDAGKHLLLEKPATTSLGEFDDLVRRARANHCTFVCSLHYAHSPDVVWFVKNYPGRLDRVLGEIAAVRSRFFDPYALRGEITSRAVSLGGSWADSGINALTVVGLLTDRLRLEEGSLIRTDGRSPVDIRADALLSFRRPSGREGFAAIAIDWSQQSDRKATEIFFENTRRRILLDHMLHRVISISAGNGPAKTLMADVGHKTRLEVHYEGVLSEFFSHIQESTNNLSFARQMHKVLFDLRDRAGYGSYRRSFVSRRGT